MRISSCSLFTRIFFIFQKVYQNKHYFELLYLIPHNYRPEFPAGSELKSSCRIYKKQISSTRLVSNFKKSSFFCKTVVLQWLGFWRDTFQFLNSLDARFIQYILRDDSRKCLNYMFELKFKNNKWINDIHAILEMFITIMFRALRHPKFLERIYLVT